MQAVFDIMPGMLGTGIGNAVGLLCLMQLGAIQYCSDMLQYTDGNSSPPSSLETIVQQLEPYCQTGKFAKQFK